MDGRGLRAALINAPFVTAFRPSIQIGLLKAAARARGFEVDTLHVTLDFARMIGIQNYEALSEHRGLMVGDWLFSVAAFGELAPDPEGRFLEEFEPALQRMFRGTPRLLERLAAIRTVHVPEFIHRVVGETEWHRYQVVGFTCAFQQTAASIALAGALKRKYPHLLSVFGGASFDGQMGLELVRKVECIDFAILGEADHTFPEFLKALSEGRDPMSVPGVVARGEDGCVRAPARPPTGPMDTLPIPDYEEFFERARRLRLLRGAFARNVSIPFESARGCWWGEKQHCVFCGLNAESMRFRSKSPDRVILELGALTRSHGSFRFSAVDNILDMSYLKTFFAELFERHYDFEFFYELKSNLTREQIRALHRGGVRRMQPGIESVNSHVLTLMRKGVTGIQNLNTLRWGRYYGIDVAWNLLWGFPGETPEDYVHQLECLRLIPHLQPPIAAGRIWMERFSPIFFARSEFPTQFVRPERSYSFVYPAHVDLDRVAYFFDYEFVEALPSETYEETASFVASWKENWKSGRATKMTFSVVPGYLRIDDGRRLEAPVSSTFDDPMASIYAACSDKPRSASSLHSELGNGITLSIVEDALHDFCVRGLMVRQGEVYLSLAIPSTPDR
jgi:ribosomal peptide maturation radical SAM protein 1